MALQDLNLNSLTNLVVHEMEPNEGYARRSILLNKSLNGVAVPMGRLAYRTIASGQLDQDALYSLVNDSTHAELVDTNEFAVVFGDGYSAKDSFSTIDDSGTDDTPAVAFVRGEVQLKEETIFAANGVGADDAGTNTTKRNKIRALLEKQGIILLQSDEAVLS